MVDVQSQKSAVEDKDPENWRQNKRLADVLVEEKGDLPVELAMEETDVIAEGSLTEFLGLENDALAGCYLEKDFVGAFRGNVAVLIELQVDSALCSDISIYVIGQ